MFLTSYGVSCKTYDEPNGWIAAAAAAAAHDGDDDR